MKPKKVSITPCRPNDGWAGPYCCFLLVEGLTDEAGVVYGTTARGYYFIALKTKL